MLTSCEYTDVCWTAHSNFLCFRFSLIQSLETKSHGERDCELDFQSQEMLELLVNDVRALLLRTKTWIVNYPSLIKRFSKWTPQASGISITRGLTKGARVSEFLRGCRESESRNVPGESQFHAHYTSLLQDASGAFIKCSGYQVFAS